MTAVPLRVPAPNPESPVLEAHGRLLVVRLSRPHAVLSWAIVNGGRTRAREVAWRQVFDDELDRHCDPAELLSASLDAADLPNAVGLLTSCDVSRFEEVVRRDGQLEARCVATVGLGNALAVGDAPGPLRAVGTINLLCQVSRPLSECALIEAVSLAAEARTAAMMEADVPSRRSSRMATGTGTDCIVIAAPEGPSPEPYIGKHTALGSLLGAAVKDATARGIRGWLTMRGAR